MILTEEEARTKLCHRTLAATVIAGEANYYPSTCVASECMAWRQRTKRLTLPPTESPGHAKDGWEASSMQPFDDMREAHRMWENERAGYCGLVDAP